MTARQVIMREDKLRMGAADHEAGSVMQSGKEFESGTAMTILYEKWQKFDTTDQVCLVDVPAGSVQIWELAGSAAYLQKIYALRTGNPTEDTFLVCLTKTIVSVHWNQW